MIRRFYQEIIQNHIEKYEQMIFISGSRQVGKTTIAKCFATSEHSYLNWDNTNHREILLNDIYGYIEKALLHNQPAGVIPAKAGIQEKNVYKT